MYETSTIEIHGQLSNLIDRVSFGKEHIVLERSGKKLAAIIPLEDLELLQKLREKAEDEEDIIQAEKLLADKTQAHFSFEQVKKELGF